MPDINDLIASGIRAPQVEDLQTARAKALTLQNLAQQQQLGQQQLQAGQLELQDKQRQIDQTKALNDAYQGSLTIGADGTPDIDSSKLTQALASGGHGSAIPGVLKGVQEYKTSSANLAKSQGEVAAQEAEAAGALGAAVRSAKYDPNLFLTLTQHAVASKHVDAAAVAPLVQQVQQAMVQDPTGEAARQIVQHFSDQFIAAAPKQRELDNSAASAAGAQARGAAATTEAGIATQKAQDAKDLQFLNSAAGATSQGQLDSMKSWAKQAGISDTAIQRVPAMFSPSAMQDFGRSLMTNEQRTQADQAATNAQNTEADRKVTQAQGAQRVGIDAGRLGVERQRYAFDANGGVSAAAQMAANGQMAPQTMRAMLRNNPGFAAQIKAVDPNFDEANIENRYNTLKEFTNTSNGKAGGQALALNTLIHHADLYLAAADALKNGSFVSGNEAYNAVASAFGSAPPTNAALLARFFAGETGKVATGGVPAEGEINGILKNLSTSASPDQIAGAGKTLLGIAAGRMQPLQERVNNAKLGNVVQVLGPDAKSILSRRGFDPATMKPTNTVNMRAPDGTVKPVPADQVDHFLKLGAKVTE